MDSQDTVESLTERLVELKTWMKDVKAHIHEIELSTLKGKLGIPADEFYIKSKWHGEPVVYRITDVAMTVDRFHIDTLTLIGHDITSKTVKFSHIININTHISGYTMHFDICSKDGSVSKDDSLKVNK